MNTHTNYFTHQANLSLIMATGEETQVFLQSQLTNDVVKLNLNNAQWNAYCTPKGRMLASFLLWKETPHNIYLQVSKDLAASIQKRLSMFVLRAKTKLSIAPESWQAYTFSGNIASATLQTQFGKLPENILDSVNIPQANLIKLADQTYLVWYSQVDYPDWLTSWQSALHQSTEDLWQKTLITQGIAHITQATYEKYVPQMANWDLIGGVSFQKGCYPGQEIVARSHYLGKLKRRMNLAEIEHTMIPTPGQDIVNNHQETIGTIVNVFSYTPTQHQVLFECAVDQWEAPIYLQANDSQALQIHKLPYAVTSKTD